MIKQVKYKTKNMNYDLIGLEEIGFTWGESMRNGGEFDKLTWGMQVGNLTYLEYEPENDCFCIVGECYQNPNLLWNLHTFEEISMLAKLLYF